MRRLPIFFVLDCSESMAGDKLQKMRDGLQAIVQSLRADPHALETAYLSVLAFAGIAKVIAPLVELPSFYPPRLPLGGGTNLGAALDALTTEIDKSVVKTTAEHKGDWRPIVYLFTDGHPTDEPAAAVERWIKRFGGKITLIAVTIGKREDVAPVLNRLTEHVILFEERKEGDFSKFVKWVTASVVAQSKSVNEGKNADGLPILDESVMHVVKDAPPKADDSCIALTGRCQQTRKPYLIKYEKKVSELRGENMRIDLPMHHLTGCYPLDEDYFEWSGGMGTTQQINTSSLVGAPGCPHCGNIVAFAVCNCGKLMCLSEPGRAHCPWCGHDVVFGPASGGDFDVARGMG